MAKFKRMFALLFAALVVVFPLPVTPHASQGMAALSAQHSTAQSHVLNSHLHGARTTKPGAINRKDEHHAHWWVNRWAYGYWVGPHRGYGAITGNVQTDGKALRGAEVLLVSTKGRPIKARHVTSTNVSGGFIMRRVRAGSYHVHAIMGERTGRAATHVYNGTIVAVQIRI